MQTGYQCLVESKLGTRVNAHKYARPMFNGWKVKQWKKINEEHKDVIGHSFLKNQKLKQYSMPNENCFMVEMLPFWHTWMKQWEKNTASVVSSDHKLYSYHNKCNHSNHVFKTILIILKLTIFTMFSVTHLEHLPKEVDKWIVNLVFVNYQHCPSLKR